MMGEIFSRTFLFQRRLSVSYSRLAGAAGVSFIFLLAVSSSGFGQQTDTRTTEQARLAIPSSTPVDDVIRIDTDVIALDVRVTDRNGRPVRNLRPEDFKLYEDGSERPISFFNIERKEGEQQPVAVVFALDTSGSMSQEEMRRLRLAMNVFAPWRGTVFAVRSHELRDECPRPAIDDE